MNDQSQGPAQRLFWIGFPFSLGGSRWNSKSLPTMQSFSGRFLLHAHLSCACLGFGLKASEEAPDWWSDVTPPVITGEPENNRGAANIGQAKWMAYKALGVLLEIDPDVAQDIELRLVGQGNPVRVWAPEGEGPLNYSPLLLGQLKAISQPFYFSLDAAAPQWLERERTTNDTDSGGIFPWTESTADDSNRSVANLGQLKAVFSLRFTDSSDGDLGSDFLEYRFFGTDQFHFDPGGDANNNGITNLDEIRANPSPGFRDLDGDGLTDAYELEGLMTDPLKRDTDEDGFPDGQQDTDGDGMSDQWEQLLIEQKADPSSWTLALITASGDEDGDGVSNFQEYQRGFSGFQADSDGDGYSDRLSVDEEVFLRLDEPSGTVAGDSSDKGRDGTLASAPSWQASGGVEGGALEFHGGDDALVLSEDVLDGTTNLTVSLWFKTSVAPASQTLLSSASALQSPELALILETGNTVRFHTGGGSSVTWTYGRSLADNLWHHLLVTRDATSGDVALQVDGAPFGGTQNLSLAPLGVDAVALGQLHLTTTSFDSSAAFIGLLDNVRVHSAVTEVEDLPGVVTEMFRPNDLDADELPDDYEMATRGNLTTLAGAGDDLDGDGSTNRQEYEGGTDPTDYYNGQTPVVTLFSGSGQRIYNGQRTPTPLVFKVTSTGGTPLAGAPLLLEHLQPIGAIETLDGDTLATSLNLRTDSQGKVTVHFKAD